MIIIITVIRGNIIEQIILFTFLNSSRLPYCIWRNKKNKEGKDSRNDRALMEYIMIFLFILFHLSCTFYRIFYRINSTPCFIIFMYINFFITPGSTDVRFDKNSFIPRNQRYKFQEWTNYIEPP